MYLYFPSISSLNRFFFKVFLYSTYIKYFPVPNPNPLLSPQNALVDHGSGMKECLSLHEDLLFQLSEIRIRISELKKDNSLPLSERVRAKGRARAQGVCWMDRKFPNCMVLTAKTILFFRICHLFFRAFENKNRLRPIFKS